MDVQDLGSSFLLRQTDLDLDLQPAGSQQGVVHHVPPALYLFGYRVVDDSDKNIFGG